MTTDRRERIRGHLATLMCEIRPEWDIAGCVAALRKVDDAIPVNQLGIAAMRYAADERNLKPTHLADMGNQAWTSDWYLPCKTHPHCRARRTNGQCADCWTDQHEDPHAGQCRDRGGKPIPATARSLFAQVIRRVSTAGDATSDQEAGDAVRT